MTARLRDSLLLTVLAALLLLPWLGATRLWDEDEGFFAGTAAEMYERGDWIVPYFNGELFGHKPPFMYWMMMLGYDAFGVNAWGARFSSALFGIATALLTCELGRRLFNARVGFLAGFVLASSLMFNVISRAATPDTFLTFFSTLALAIFASAGLARGNSPGESGNETRSGQLAVLPSRWSAFALMYAVMGLAVLVKGPIGVLLPMAIIGMFLLCQTERRLLPENASRWQHLVEAIRPFGPRNFLLTIWRMRPLTALAIVLLVAAPWYVAVGWRTDGEFLREFFGVHHFQRFSTAMENHQGSIFYYVFSILIGMFPWSNFAIPLALFTISRMRRGEARKETTFLLCWAGVQIGLFSLAATKLPNYVLPAYPALALLCGAGLDQWITDRRRVSTGWMQAGLAILTVTGLAVCLGFPLAAGWEWDGGQTLLDRFRVARPIQAVAVSLWPIGLPILCGGGLAFWFSRHARGGRAIGTVGATALVMLGLLWGFAAPRADRLQTPQEIAQLLRQRDAQGTQRVAHYGFFKPSMVFYSGHVIETCHSEQAVVDYFQAPNPGLLITTSRAFDHIRQRLPEDVTVLERRPQFPKPGEIVLLGRSLHVAQGATPSETR